MVEKIKTKVLITGIRGMLGQDINQVFCPDYEVYGIDVSLDKTSQGRIFFADITDLESLEKIFSKLKPGLVIHSAAFTNVDAAESEQEQAKAVNVLGTKNIAFLSQKYKSKLVFISTDYVYDGSKKSAYLETDFPNPINYYGRSKLEAEQLIGKYVKEYIIVRTSWLFGHNGKNFVKAIINKARLDGALKVVDDQFGSPTYTLHLAQGLAWLINSVFQSAPDISKYGIYHLTNSGNCSWFEFAQEIIEKTGIKARIDPVDSDFVKRAAKRPKFSVLDKGRFEKVTGKQLCQWQQALEQYLSRGKESTSPEY